MKGKSRQSEIFSHFASILPVKNVSKSIVFYQDKLGIELTFSWNNPVDYAVVKRGGVRIQLANESLLGETFYYPIQFRISLEYNSTLKL